MIEEPNPKDCPSLLQSPRRDDLATTRLGIAGRMIVHQDHRVRSAGDRGAENFAGRNEGFVQASDGYQVEKGDSELRVETEDHRLFLLRVILGSGLDV